ncbi:hypothetical protein GW7_20415 [Heterocephalus glaber]|uniref:Uncharacterized protein n=1 Tax=Heterocephalus glaber TaxID=10181 RepID=G5BAL2_HETGA|nr:hypothetical protein GW7_20415 [Heterocephalus glaber]
MYNSPWREMAGPRSRQGQAPKVLELVPRQVLLDAGFGARCTSPDDGLLTQVLAGSWSSRCRFACISRTFWRTPPELEPGFYPAELELGDSPSVSTVRCADIAVGGGSFSLRTGD